MPCRYCQFEVDPGCKCYRCFMVLSTGYCLPYHKTAFEEEKNYDLERMKSHG